MVNSYSLPLFLRQTPNGMMDAYFRRRGLLSAFPFFLLGRRPDYLLETIAALGAPERALVERDFQDISRLSSRWGTGLIVSALAARGVDAGAVLADLENQHARAMWFFLHHGVGEGSPFARCAAIARTHHGTGLRIRRRHGLPQRPPRFDDEALARVAAGLRAFYSRQGRGEHCCVLHEHLAQPERHYFLALPEGYAESNLEYEDGDLRHAARKTVFEVTFSFLPEEGILEIRAPGPKEEIDALAQLFCEAVLPDVPHGVLDGGPSVALDGLLAPGLRLVGEPDDEIETVEISALRVNVRGEPQPQFTIVAAPAEPIEFHRVVRRSLAPPLEDLEVTQAKLRFVWTARDGAASQCETVELSAPHGVTLAGGSRDAVIRRCLRRWGLAA